MSKIEWTDRTYNWLAGCTKVSPACLNCYAESMSGRLANMPNAPERYRDVVKTDPVRWSGKINFDRAALREAFRRMGTMRNGKVFANSMSDTFHEDAPLESLLELANEIVEADKLAALGKWKAGWAGGSDFPTVTYDRRRKR